MKRWSISWTHRPSRDWRPPHHRAVPPGRRDGGGKDALIEEFDVARDEAETFADILVFFNDATPLVGAYQRACLRLQQIATDREITVELFCQQEQRGRATLAATRISSLRVLAEALPALRAAGPAAHDALIVGSASATRAQVARRRCVRRSCS